MSPPTVSSLGERALIERITARLATPSWVVVGPGDDAAVIEPERGTLDVLTTDALVEGIHFDRRFVPAAAIGHRALAVNVSDLAAMGARPRAALLSLMLPDAFELEALDAMVEGLTTLAGRYGIAVAGGNITRSPERLIVDVTAIGSIGRRRILRRTGARPGDVVYVTGTVGDAVAGLGMLREGGPEGPRLRTEGGPEGPRLGTEGNRCVERFLRPEPRVKAGRVLAGNRLATSCVDLSDGLADGVRQLAHASGVGIALDETAIPVSPEARAWLQRQAGSVVEAAITGGDDYELLFTARPTGGRRLKIVEKALGELPITRIGTVTSEPRLTIGGRELPHGFEHFR